MVLLARGLRTRVFGWRTYPRQSPCPDPSFLMPRPSTVAGDHARLSRRSSSAWGEIIHTGDRLWSVGYPSLGAFDGPAWDYGHTQYFCNNTIDEIDPYGSTYALVHTPCRMITQMKGLGA